MSKGKLIRKAVTKAWKDAGSVQLPYAVYRWMDALTFETLPSGKRAFIWYTNASTKGTHTISVSI